LLVVAVAVKAGYMKPVKSVCSQRRTSRPSNAIVYFKLETRLHGLWALYEAISFEMFVFVKKK
jgi:hypothetical protein